MQLLQKRGVALVVCALMIVAACLLGTMSSLARLRAQSEELFSLGPDGDGRGIQYDLNEMSTQCHNITVIAGRYLDENDPAVAAVRGGRDTLARAASPRGKRAAAEELRAAATLLRSRLEGLELDRQDKTLLTACAEQINSAQRLIDINMGDYNAGAAYYNRVLRGFPVGLLAPLTGAEPLELYE